MDDDLTSEYTSIWIRGTNGGLRHSRPDRQEKKEGKASDTRKHTIGTKLISQIEKDKGCRKGKE